MRFSAFKKSAPYSTASLQTSSCTSTGTAANIRFLQLVVPLTHLHSLDLRPEAQRRPEARPEASQQHRAVLVKIFEREITLKNRLNMVKELLLEKTSFDYPGLFAVVDRYSDGVMDPDK